MKAFEVTTRVNAPAERVWETLLDTALWPSFDPAIERVDGAPIRGGTMTVHTTRGRAFPMKVTTLVAHQRMVLTGGMPLGLFKGERTYTVSPNPDGSVQFSMREAFTGLLAPLVGRSLPDMQPSFDTFAANLKHRSERAD
jgi:hypothetical protein